MYQHQGAHLSTGGVHAFTYHACKLSAKRLRYLNLAFLENILLVLDPNVLNTPLTIFR